MPVDTTCPWIDNRTKKEVQKTMKYELLRWELKNKYPGQALQQVNIVIDVLGGYSKELGHTMRELFEDKRTRNILQKM